MSPQTMVSEVRPRQTQEVASGARRRIVLVISNLEFGGAQRQIVELANAMDPLKYEAHVVSLSPYVPLAQGLRLPSGQSHVIRKRFKFDLTVIPRLARLLRRVRADVVHGYLFDAEIASRLAGWLAGTPLIVGSERNTDYYLKRRQLLVYRLTRGLTDLVVANSGAGAKFNRRMLGHPEPIYRVVHNGVDSVRFAPRPASENLATRREIGLADDEAAVGMFASFKEQKNQPLLLRAAKLVLARRPRTRFVFVGDELYLGMHGSDEYKRCVEKLIDELGVRERCLFLGNRDDVQRLYPACDLTVLPSLYEGTPNVALESMASGTPVIATDVSDNAYVIPDGRAGFVVPLGDERALADRILALLEDAELRGRLGRQAREWVEQEFTTARLAQKTVEIYEQGLRERARR